MKIGINGFGRIGRQIFRILHERGMSDSVVLVNDLMPNETMAQLLKYDSNYGKFEGEVSFDDSGLTVDGHKIKVTDIKDPAEIPWGDNGVDIVVESTGLFRKREQAIKHINGGGAKKVLISAPSGDADFDIMMGVNAHEYDAESGEVVSNASCTTNSLAAIMKIMDDTFGVEQAMMTTIHSYTNDQNILDAPHSDLRRARAAAFNIVPTSTGAANAVKLVYPNIEDKLSAIAVRVPVITGSMIEVNVNLEKEVTADQVNEVFRKHAEGDMKGILQYSTDPLVSSDIVRNTHSSIFDSQMTSVNKDMLKVVSWYDNEAGYSARLADLAALILNG